MKKLFCILVLLLCMALPALAEDVLPDFEALTNGALTTKEQLVMESCVRTGYTGPAAALTQAVDAYLVQLSDFGMQQQLKLPLKQADCTITLYAFAKADSTIPAMTCADASLGWVISETHLVLDLRVYADGEATVEVIVRPELLVASAAERAPEPAAKESSINTCSLCEGTGAYKTVCVTCSGSGMSTRSCSTCDGQGRTVCSACNGKKYSKCGTCSGHGTRSCSTCGGSGHHGSSHHGTHHNSGSSKCNSCGGDGKRSCSSCGGDGKQNCGTCHSSGTRNCTDCQSGTVRTRCSSCSSTGHYTVSCDLCGGSGVIK